MGFGLLLRSAQIFHLTRLVHYLVHFLKNMALMIRNLMCRIPTFNYLRRHSIILYLILFVTGLCLLMVNLIFENTNLTSKKQDSYGMNRKGIVSLRKKGTVPPEQYLEKEETCVFTHGDVVEDKQKAIVHVKMMKCASTSLAGLIKRFAYKYKLEVALPINNKIYIGWPYSPQRTHILDVSRDKFYQVATDHVVYNRQFFERIMVPNTSYITSLRYPYSQFKSMVNYYNILNISGVPHLRNMAKRFQHYILNLEHYDSIYKLSESSPLRFCVPDGFSMTKNLMSFNLGFPHLGGFNDKINLSEGGQLRTDDYDPSITVEYSSALKAHLTRESIERSMVEIQVDEWLGNLNKEMDLVLIVEYLPESLILMRRKFCWSMEDVLLLNINALDYNFKVKKKQRNSELEMIYRSWSWIDYELYNYFNKTLWRKLNFQPVSFWSEVERLKVITGNVLKFCSRKELFSNLTIEESKWNDKFEVDASVCSSKTLEVRDSKLKNYYIERLKMLGHREVKPKETFC